MAFPPQGRLVLLRRGQRPPTAGLTAGRLFPRHFRAGACRGGARGRGLPDARLGGCRGGISERKHVEKRLRDSEARYRLIVENQTEFIVKWLPDCTRTFVNEHYCQLFGLTEEECLGTRF